MAEPKLLVVSTEGTVPRFGFTRKDPQATWKTIVNDVINRNYCLAYELRDGYNNDAAEEEKIAVLKYDPLTKYAFIYGWGTMNYDLEYRVYLDESELHGTSPSSPTSPVTEDNTESLTCYITGLPNEIKLQIIESLDGVDTARLGCVSSDFRNLTSNDRLWEHKFQREFKNLTSDQSLRKNIFQWEFCEKVRQKVKGLVEGENSWKHKFGEAWRVKKLISKKLIVPLEAVCQPFSSKNYIDFVVKHI